MRVVIEYDDFGYKSIPILGSGKTLKNITQTLR